MSGDPKNPRVPSWRKDVKAPAQRRQAAQPEWRKEASSPVLKSGWSRRTKLGIGSLLLLTFSGLLFYVILWLRPPKQACLVLVGAGYEENLAVPHNVFGLNGLEALAELGRGGDDGFFWWKSSLFRLKHEPRELRSELDWDVGLNNVAERTVIVFLALHGGVDQQGAYLLPQDADLGEERRLRIDKVLTRLEELRDKRVLLILDATQVASNWPMGTLRNDFARKLKELKDRIAGIPHLLVMCSSDEDERSWASEEYRQTIFAHYVVEGLKGAAAPDGSRRITARDLHRYVQSHVKDWVRANRSALQQPMLLGNDDLADKMEVTAAVAYTPPAAPEVPDYKSTDFEGIHETYLQLARLAPSPAVYAPQLWRLFLDTFLRFEQLVRAGDQRKTGELKKEIDRLADAIKGEARLELDSAQNALAMPVALGIRSPWPQDDLAARILELWNAAVPEREQKWEEIRKLARGDRWLGYVLRQQLSRLLIERALQNLKENLEKAVTLLQVVNGRTNERSAEVHFLRMLMRDLDAKDRPDLKLLEDAIRLRLDAENVALAMPTGKAEGHPYSEQVFPWIKAKVERADQDRRWCHDHLFGGSEAWPAARTHLLSASGLAKPGEGYKGAQRDADVVRDALRTCHEVLMGLPDYSQWLARRYVYEESDRNAVNEQVQIAEELWENLHYLVRQLSVSKPEEMTRRLTTDLRLETRDPDAGLARQTTIVRTAYERLLERFDKDCKRLAEETNYTQAQWHAINDALGVPFVEPRLRLRLLNMTRQISRRLFQETQGKIAEAGLSADNNARLSQESASRNGRLAVASLGQRWFEDPQFKATEEYGKTQIAVKVSSAENWWRSLVTVGEAVSLRWRTIPDQVRKLTENARSVAPTGAAELLNRAELLTRQMSGCTVRQNQPNPVREARRLRTYELLLWLGQRTFEDHWFAEDEAFEPYYRDAGKLYCKDARLLLESSRNELSPQEQRSRLEVVAKLDEQFNLPGELTPERTLPQRPELNFTAESKISLEYQLKAKGTLPQGFPVAWMESAEKALVVREPAGRRILETNAKAPLQFRLDAPTAGAVNGEPKLKATAMLHGLYRGQRLRKPEPMTIYLQPDIVAYSQPTPPGAGIAVRAAPDIHEQFSPYRGAVTIVLDCSGSMRGTDPVWNAKTPCKYHDVTNVLRRVLGELPTGVHVSVFVFSHALGRRAPNGKPYEDQPENPEDWIKCMRTTRPWNPKELPGLMDVLEDLAPFNDTPLVSAMMRARDEGFPKNFTGFKTMLVLTDGEDTTFRKDRKLQQRHNTDDIGKFVAMEFDDPSMLVNFVGFRVAEGEAKKLQEQFKEALEKKLKRQGKFFTTDNAAELSRVLPKLMTQELRFKLERDGGGEIPGMPPDGWLIGRPEEPQRWIPLEEGAYRLRIQLDQLLDQRIQLERGDFLVASVRGDRKGFERIPMGNIDTYKWREDRETEGWLQTLLQNQYKPSEKRLDVLLTVESLSDRFPTLQTTLKQIRPRPQSIWIEAKPQNTDAQPTQLRWGEFHGYPAPTWRLSMTNWPFKANTQEPALPLLDVWWNWRRDLEPYDTIRKADDASYRSLEGKELRLGQDPMSRMRIESIEVEERELEQAFDQKSQKVKCLVIQVAYPMNQRIWVQPDSLDVKGYEHHYYSKAGRYTGVFWPVTEAGVQNNFKALRIYSVESFKSSPNVVNAQFRVKESEPPDRRDRPTTIPERMSQSTKP